MSLYGGEHINASYFRNQEKFRKFPGIHAFYENGEAGKEAIAPSGFAR